MGSGLGSWTKPSLRQRAGVVVVLVMFMVLHLNPPVAAMITSTQEAGAQLVENQIVENQLTDYQAAVTDSQISENHVLIETWTGFVEAQAALQPVETWTVFIPESQATDNQVTEDQISENHVLIETWTGFVEAQAALQPVEIWTGVILENQATNNQVVIEVTFDRRLSGDRVGQHKVPPLSPVNMTITATVSSQVDNAILADYFPSDWTVTDANGGIVSINKIEWEVGAVSDSVSRSYVLRSPQLTSPPTKYYFHSELTYGGRSATSDDWRVIVADPPDQETLRPNAVGYYQEWDCDNGTHWGATSDQDNTTFIYTNVNAERDIENLVDPTFDEAATINWVQINFTANATGTGGPEKAFNMYRVDGTDYEDTKHTITKGSWNDYMGTQLVGPGGVGSWTYAQVTALEAGASVNAVGGAENIWITEIWVVVDYTPAAPGKPVLVSPENNYQTSDNTPTFTWENGANATYHRLVIDNSPDFSDGDNIYDNANIYDNTCTIENELPPDNYWWHVAAGGGGIENWSENTRRIEIIPRAWQLIETWTGTIEAPALWKLIETWTGTVSAPAQWQLIETWTGTVSAPVAWNLIETWTGTVSAPAQWNLIETWTGTVSAPTQWNLIETWIGTVSAPAVWQLIETWTGTVSAPAQWNLIESWTGTVSAPVQWNLIETWTGTVSAPTQWNLIETWTGMVSAPAVWQLIESWTGTVSAPVQWSLIESWTGTVSAPVQWSLIESWTGTVSAPTQWNLIEIWTGTVSAPVVWQLVETWTGTVSVPVQWNLIETWTGTVSAPVQWSLIESWTGTVSAPTQWNLIEIWTGTVSAPVVWQLVETWTGTVEAPAAWQLVETWTGTIKAPAVWQLIETWTGTVEAPLVWRLIETWTSTVEAPAAWQLIETWTGTVEAPAAWQLVETWTGTIKAPVVWQLIETWTGAVEAPLVWRLIETWTSTVEAPAAWQLIETWIGEVVVPGFTISVNPTSGSVKQGDWTTATITITSIQNYSLTVSLEASVQPSDVAITFTPPSGTPTFESTMTILAGSNAQAGDYPIAINGTGADNKVRTCTYVLTITAVTPPPPPPPPPPPQDTTPPPIPLLISPADGAKIEDDTPTFTWTTVSDPSGVTYSLQVDNDADFSSPEINVTSLIRNAYTPTIALADGDYSWRVRAVDGANNFSDWFTVWSFKIETAVPPPPPPPPVVPPTPTPSLMPIFYALLATFAALGGGYVTYLRWFRPIPPAISLKWLRRVAMRGRRKVKLVEARTTDITTSLERLRDATSVEKISVPIPPLLEGFKRAVVWKPKPAKARITKAGRADVKRFKRLWCVTEFNYRVKRLQQSKNGEAL